MAEEESDFASEGTFVNSDDEEADENDFEKSSVEEETSLDSRPTEVSFHRPTNTEELFALVPDDIPILFGDDGIVNIEDLIIPENEVEVDDPCQSKETSLNKLIHLEKLSNLVAELITTEIDYVRDVGLLCGFLDECTYCPYTAVHSFVNSTTFIGFRVATDNIKSINTLFLKSLQDKVGTLRSIAEARIDMTEENIYPAIEILKCLCNVFSDFSPLFTQYKHLIQLHRPITILYAALGDNRSFLKFVTDVEKKLHQNFLSLSIKPVQRLPRYILLLKEMLKCIHRSVMLFSDSDKDLLVGTRMSLRNTCVDVANCTLSCNNAMREYEDLQKLHCLDRQFKDCQLKKKYNFVTIRKNRVLVLEGEIRRRHDRIGQKSYLCHVFSDTMLISAVAGKGGLRLKNIIPLSVNSGVACVPIPDAALSSSECSEDGCWFAMVLPNKIMYLSAKTTFERDKWVKAINSVLFKNRGDYDILHNYERMNLFNTHIDKYYKRHGETDSCMEEAESAVCVTQVNWWSILSLTAADKDSINRTLSQQNTKSIDRLLKTFDKKKLGVLEQVLNGSKVAHFPICCDYFFHFPKKSSRSVTSTDFVPPAVVKCFLFHDVIIAASLTGNDNGRSGYYFHVDLASLEVSSDSSLSITLTDTSIVSSKSIVQNLLWKSPSRAHTLVASSLAGKRTWLRLLQEALATLKASSPISVNPQFCTKVRLSGMSCWKYEDRPSINWDNLG